MSNYRDTNGTITQDSGAIRVSPRASNDPLAGSFIDSRDGKRRKYVGSQLYVWQNDAWVLDSVRATDSSDAPPTGKSIRQNYLDQIEQARLRQLQPAQPATSDAAPAPTLTPKQAYLAELERRGSRG